MKNKIIQISTSVVGRGTPILFALFQNGNIQAKLILSENLKEFTDGEWRQLDLEKLIDKDK